MRFSRRGFRMKLSPHYRRSSFFFFFNDPPTTEIYTLSLHDALPISTPQILSLISPSASTMTKIALQLAIFVVAAVPGYLLAIARLDKIGHRRLQLLGFAMMGLCFL